MASASPDKVATSFIKQYYKMLSSKPDELSRFYKDMSSFTHCEGPQVETPVIGAKAIQEKVNTLDLAGARVDLQNGSFDFQGSVNGGVFLMVTGDFTARGCAPRPFVQSFFLAQQDGQDMRFFVMNSVFRPLGPFPAAGSVEPAPAPTQPGASAHTIAFNNEADKGAGSAPAPVTDVADPMTLTETEGLDGQQEGDEEEGVNEPLGNGTAEVGMEPEEAEAEMDAVVPSIIEVADEPHDESPEVSAPVPAWSTPRSFVDAVKKSLPAKESSPPKARAQRAPSTATPTGAVAAGGVAPAAGAAAATQRSPVKGKVERTEVKSQYPKSEPVSLFVSNLAEPTTEVELREVFEKYGPVRKLDQPPGRDFIFVEFETAESCQAALADTTPVELHGKLLRVELRQRRGPPAHKYPAAKPRNGPPRKWTGSKENGGRRGGPDTRGERNGDRKERASSRSYEASA